MKKYQELKEYLGGFRLGSFPTLKPMTSLGDKGPNKPAGQQSLGVGINAAYSSQAAGTMRPFLKAQQNTVLNKIKNKFKDWKKYDKLTRILMKDKEWKKAYKDVEKSLDDYKKIVDKIAKQAGK